MPTPLTATITIHNSRADVYGNRYWGFTFTDHATGRAVSATISGGASNIEAIRLCWGNPKGWDSSVMVIRNEHPIREYNRLVKDWPYAGCSPEDLAAWIRAQGINPPCL